MSNSVALWLSSSGLIMWHKTLTLVNRTTGSFASFICWTEDFIIGRTKRDNLILVLNRPIITKNNQ
jgi:hypothetical protein